MTEHRLTFDEILEKIFIFSSHLDRAPRELKFLESQWLKIRDLIKSSPLVEDIFLMYPLNENQSNFSNLAEYLRIYQIDDYNLIFKQDRLKLDQQLLSLTELIDPYLDRQSPLYLQKLEEKAYESFPTFEQISKREECVMQEGGFLSKAHFNLINALYRLGMQPFERNQSKQDWAAAKIAQSYENYQKSSPSNSDPFYILRHDVFPLHAPVSVIEDWLNLYSNSVQDFSEQLLKQIFEQAPFLSEKIMVQLLEKSPHFSPFEIEIQEESFLLWACHNNYSSVLKTCLEKVASSKNSLQNQGFLLKKAVEQSHSTMIDMMLQDDIFKLWSDNELLEGLKEALNRVNFEITQKLLRKHPKLILLLKSEDLSELLEANGHQILALLIEHHLEIDDRLLQLCVRKKASDCLAVLERKKLLRKNIRLSLLKSAMEQFDFKTVQLLKENLSPDELESFLKDEHDFLQRVTLCRTKDIIELLKIAAAKNQINIVLYLLVIHQNSLKPKRRHRFENFTLSSEKKEILEIVESYAKDSESSSEILGDLLVRQSLENFFGWEEPEDLFALKDADGKLSYKNLSRIFIEHDSRYAESIPDELVIDNLHAEILSLEIGYQHFFHHEAFKTPKDYEEHLDFLGKKGYFVEDFLAEIIERERFLKEKTPLSPEETLELEKIQKLFCDLASSWLHQSASFPSPYIPNTILHHQIPNLWASLISRNQHRVFERILSGKTHPDYPTFSSYRHFGVNMLLIALENKSDDMFKLLWTDLKPHEEFLGYHLGEKLVRSDRFDLIQYAFDCGLELEKTSLTELIMLSLSEKKADIFTFLLEKYPTLFSENQELSSYNLLAKLIVEEKKDELKFALQSNIPLSNKFIQNLFLAAVRHNRREAFQILLDKGFRPHVFTLLTSWRSLKWYLFRSSQKKPPTLSAQRSVQERFSLRTEFRYPNSDSSLVKPGSSQVSAKPEPGKFKNHRIS